MFWSPVILHVILAVMFYHMLRAVVLVGWLVG